MTSSFETAFLRPQASRRAIRGLDAESLDRLSGRLARVAGLLAFISIIVLILATTVPRFIEFEKAQSISTRWSLFGQLVISLVVMLLASKRRIPRRWLLGVLISYQVWICWEAALAGTLYSIHTTGQVPFVTFCEVLIVFFPLTLPARPIHAVVAGLISASTRVPAVLVSTGFDLSKVDSDWWIGAIVSPFIAVLLALTGTRLLFGLRKEIDEAKRVGSYELKEKLGAGGMGEVWSADHRMLARPAAIKFIRGKGDERLLSAALERFEREAQATALLKSPHTVKLYDFGRADNGSFFYVMELLDGLNLHDLVERYGAIPPERAIHFARQVCHSLAEAHAADLVHRDIKPSNLLSCRYGLEHDHIVVVDFGLVTGSPKFKYSSQLTAVDQTIGTPAFISPEAARGDTIDHRADIYGLGCVIYWLLAGRLVFEAESPMAMAVAHASDTPPSLAEVSEFELPDELVALTAEMLAKNPDERPQSVTELSARLAKIDIDPAWDAARAAKWWKRHRPLE